MVELTIALERWTACRIKEMAQHPQEIIIEDFLTEKNTGLVAPKPVQVRGHGTPVGIKVWVFQAC
jgi:hypothetical protein